MHSSNTLLYLILILIAARAGGEIAVRLRQPAVLGEIIAGVALGLIPAIHPAITDNAILFIAEIGVMLLLFEVGLESELDDFLKVGPPAVMVAVIGVILPLIVGLGAIYLIGYTWQTALFLGGTLTATSIGITARVLADLRQSKCKEAKIIIGAAVVDDILGLLVLSVVMGVATGAAIHASEIVLPMLFAVLFLFVSTFIGVRSIPFLIGLTKHMKSRGILAVSAFTFGLILAYLGTLLGLAAIIGAFAAGLVLASTDDRVKIADGIRPVVDIFAPVFFAIVGMHVNLSLLNPARPESWPIFGLIAVLLLVAIPTKLIAGIGAFKQGVDKLTVGWGMVPRGEVGLIFAKLGLDKGLIDNAVYGAIVLVVLLTTVVTPPFLKRRLVTTSRRKPPTAC